MNERLDKLSHSLKERLAFIEFRTYFFGEVKRSDIIERFGVATAAATRDLAMYRLISSNNIELNQSTKTYFLSPSFEPLFEHSQERVLSAISQGFGEGTDGHYRPLLPCEVPRTLNIPNIQILAPLTRAIYLRKAVKITYHSFSSGKSVREIVPFALAYNGLRWHVRAFDRKRQRFLDFVLTRIESPKIIDNKRIEEHEEPTNDIQWNRIVELELVPHPDREHHEIIAMDYGMKYPESILNIRVRAALAGYFLRQWSVDCSENHSLSETEVRLWLRNSLALYGIDSSEIAPGYQQKT
jgi:hypothetical protein